MTIKANLPQDVDGQNDDRAEWAEEALSAFQATTGTDDETAIGDLLCDLMHLCDRRGAQYGSFQDALDAARSHYAAETGAAPY